MPRSAPAFGDRLHARVSARQSQIVLGLDPDPGALWPGCEPTRPGSPVAGAAEAVLAHCRALIDAVAPACVAVKPQLARFEVLGATGWEALERTIHHARDQGLMVIADGKRGDIDVTADAYARALMGESQTPWGPAPGLGAEMATVNPLMGSDALTPFVAQARRFDACPLLLVRTSNPGAADFEELELADGGRLWERIARTVEALGAENVAECGLGDVGAVVGATVPAQLARARELMPRTVFLLPGVGAQGGRVEDLAPAFAPGISGGLIAASRSIAGAYLLNGGDPAEAARAEAERLRALAWSLCE
ncbi:MAG TPA: orotidine-5'-phosphate decarboxylase [Solirubrobacteraceae bacterium]|nr:orotidine-5'-phosphate decarboxylase [Solirubrobacteraceae bacterium]